MARKAAPTKKIARPKRKDLDLSAFPPATVKRSSRWLCLACIFNLFTKQMKMAPKTAYAAVRGHEPSAEELTAHTPARPYFDSSEKTPHCPYCDAASTRAARLDIVRLDGGRTTTEPRKKLFDSLPKSDTRFLVLEEKARKRDLLFQWLDDLAHRFDFESRRWLMDASRAFLEKREPKTDWAPVFDGLRFVNRSHRLEEGWERIGQRLYLAPSLYDELLLMQYLVSRSHTSGGYTFEGRLTLQDLLIRLRRRGYFTEHGISGEDPFEFLENLVEALDHGGESQKIYYLVDRRELLEKSKALYARLSA